MKKLILLLLFPIVLFAQYGASLPGTNWDMELDAGWTDYLGGDTNERSSTQANNGTYSRHLVVSTFNEGCIQTTPNASVVSGTTYLYGYWYYLVSGVGCGLLNNTANIVIDITSTGGTGAWHMLAAEVVAAGTGTIRPRIISKGGGAEFYADDVFCRKKLTTIYISSTGSNTAEGESGTPIATIDECDFRGYYAGGAVNIAAGTYDETMDVTAGITITGNNCTVTAISCGSNAVTLEGTDFVITTLTGTNITDNRTVSTQDKDFKERTKKLKRLERIH